MKFSYGKTFLLGFGFFGVSVIWMVYNTFVPLFLSNRFGLDARWVGFFMTLDNIAALLIQPRIGGWSDRVRTPIGRRMPFILIGAPIGAAAFGLIPVAAVLPLFVACTSTLLVSMAFWRAPVVALMPDITPSQYRSQANGIINFMGGIGAVIATLGGSRLYAINQAYPFWMGSALVLMAALLVFIFIKEPKEYTIKSDAAESTVSTESLLPAREGEVTFSYWIRYIVRRVFIFIMGPELFQSLVSEIKNKEKSGLFILTAIFFWFVAYNAIEAFFTLFAQNHLGLPGEDGARLLGQLSLIFVIFALPAGYIGAKFGRRRTIMTGILIMTACMLAMYFLPAQVQLIQVTRIPVLGVVPVLGLILMVAGASWALINVNSLPMVVDMTDFARIGTYTGLYYMFSTLAAIAGPNINGQIIYLGGNNYGLVMIIGPLFMLMALAMMFGVRRGEAKTEEPAVIREG